MTLSLLSSWEPCRGSKIWQKIITINGWVDLVLVAELGDVLQPVLLQRHEHLVLLQGSQPAGGQGTPGLLLLRKERPFSISLILLLFLLSFCLCYLSVSLFSILQSLTPLWSFVFLFFSFFGSEPFIFHSVSPPVALIHLYLSETLTLLFFSSVSGWLSPCASLLVLMCCFSYTFVFVIFPYLLSFCLSIFHPSLSFWDSVSIFLCICPQLSLSLFLSLLYSFCFSYPFVSVIFPHL